MTLAAGNTLSATESLIVSAEAATPSATFTLEEDATVRDTVVLADARAAANSMNRLTLSGATLSADKIVSERAAESTARIGLLLKKGATLKLTGAGELFADFKTAPDKDEIALGENGATLLVTAAQPVVQESTAAISDDTSDADPTTHHLVKDGAGTLVLTAENTFSGNVFVKAGVLKSTSLAGLGQGTDLVLGDNVDHVADGRIATPTPNAVAPHFVRRARSLAAAPNLTATSTDPVTGTYQADYATDTVWDRNISGTGNFEKLGAGKLTFTNAHTYTHRGTTTVKAGTLALNEGVNFANSALVLEKGIIETDVGEHRVRALSVSGSKEESMFKVYLNNGATYAKYKVAETATINGGKLDVDLRRFVGTFDANFHGNLIPNVITMDETGTLSGSGFLETHDNSVLFDFTAVMDPDNTLGYGKAVHLKVKAASTDDASNNNSTPTPPDNPNPTNPDTPGTTPSTPPSENVCAGMGKVECIVRKYGDTHAVPLAKVADKEFADNPGGRVAQYFYSIDTEQRVDDDAVRGLPLMTGSINQTLQHDAQAAAAYAPRDPCDSRATEHGVNLWTQLEQNWDQQGALHGSTGYQGRHSTLAIGNDVCVKDQGLRVGALVAYTDSSVKSHGNQAVHSAKTDLYQIGLYGDKQLTEKTDVDFQVGYARGRVEGHRNLKLFTADSKYDVNLAYAGLGLNWHQAWFTPFARFDYAFVRAGAYKESGADVFNYAVDAQTRHSGILQLGSRFDWAMNDRWHVKGKVAVGYEVLDKYNTITTAFEGIPQSPFTTRSAENHRVMGLFETGVTYQANDKLDFSLNYRAIIKPDYHDQGGQVQMTVHF